MQDWKPEDDRRRHRGLSENIDCQLICLTLKSRGQGWEVFCIANMNNSKMGIIVILSYGITENSWTCRSVRRKIQIKTHRKIWLQDVHIYLCAHTQNPYEMLGVLSKSHIGIILALLERTERQYLKNWGQRICNLERPKVSPACRVCTSRRLMTNAANHINAAQNQNQNPFTDYSR